MTKEQSKQIIETTDEEGNAVNFELFDIINFENREYALLLPAESDNDNDEVVVMRLIKEGEDYLFEAIEDDAEFDKIVQYLENLEDEAQ